MITKYRKHKEGYFKHPALGIPGAIGASFGKRNPIG